MIDQIKELAATYQSEILTIRRHLHQHPELSFEEHQTSAYLQTILSEWNIPFESGWVETGIVAYIKGKNPTSKTIALRADIDALPIQEENTFDFKSINDGVMHACGHDLHTSSLLGVIRILSQLTDQFQGTIKCLFQPGEEKLPGGASLMIEQGVLQNPAPRLIVGQHVYPDLPAGKVGFRNGRYMASADELYLTVKGKGGHAALPHKNIDPITIACQIVVALQQLVSRNARPDIPTVLSFGKMHANGATNVIPDEVKLEGTFRTFNETWRVQAHEKMVKMANAIAEGMGGTCEFEVRKGYPFLVNDDEATNLARSCAQVYLGSENVVDLDLRMTAEDFAYYSQKIPGCFYRLGTAFKGEEKAPGLHTATLNINEEALEVGMGLMAYIAVKQLETIAS